MYHEQYGTASTNKCTHAKSSKINYYLLHSVDDDFDLLIIILYNNTPYAYAKDI